MRIGKKGDTEYYENPEELNFIPGDGISLAFSQDAGEEGCDVTHTLTPVYGATTPPTDALFNAATVQDGMIYIDTATPKIWARVGGVWKGITIA